MYTKLKKANHISEVYRAFDRSPLKLEDLDEFYKDTSKARGKTTTTTTRIGRQLRNNTDINQHLLFVGYSGCGKSTELRRLEKDIKDQFLVFNFSVFNELDPNNLNYIELVIVTMEKMFTYVKNNPEVIKISDRYIEHISHFLREEEVTEIREKYMGLGADFGKGKDSLSLSVIQKFFAKFTASIKGSKSIKTELKKKIEPRYSELVEHCNALIREIKLSLAKSEKSDLLIIIEDLDKIKIQEARSLFFEYASQITSIAANIIYTFPIGLYYDTQFNPIKAKFNEIFELPMIMVKSKNGEEVEEGINAMKKIIAARMDLKLFEDESILKDLILYSGGCLRDLFEMIKEAAENCQDEERLIISQVDKKSAYNKIKKEYRNTIADHLDANGKVDVNAREYYEILNRLANDPDKEMDNTIPEMHLRQNLTILGYNGEGWCDVHPIMKEILKDRKPKA